jgi:hypothetical protein
MNPRYRFYLCPTCFTAQSTEDKTHLHIMLCCDPGTSQDQRRRPLIDDHGRVLTRAPRWFLEAVGWIPGVTGVRDE